VSEGEEKQEEKIQQEDELSELKEITEFLKALKGTSKEEAQAVATTGLAKPTKENIKLLSNITFEEVSYMAEELVTAKRYRHARHIADYTIEELFLRCSIGGWRGRQLENIVIEGAKAEKPSLFRRIGRFIKRKGEEMEVENLRLE